MGLKIAEQFNRLEFRPVLRSPTRRRDNAVERIEKCGLAILAEKRGIEERFRENHAAAEWRLSAELLQYQLFNRVVEHPPTGANAGLAGIAGTPRDPNTRGK